MTDGIRAAGNDRARCDVVLCMKSNLNTTTLGAISAGSTIVLHRATVTVDDVEQLGRLDQRGSAMHGFPLTRIGFRSGGRTVERVYLSTTPVQQLPH